MMIGTSAGASAGVNQTRDPANLNALESAYVWLFVKRFGIVLWSIRWFCVLRRHVRSHARQSGLGFANSYTWQSSWLLGIRYLVVHTQTHSPFGTSENAGYAKQALHCLFTKAQTAVGIDEILQACPVDNPGLGSMMVSSGHSL